MTWYGHKTVTFLGVLAATGNPLAAFIAGVGSIFPDLVELMLAGLPRHRGWTHWLWLYLTLVVACFACHATQGHVLWLIGGWFYVGAAAHVLEDACSTGGVPFGWPGGRRFGLGLYRTFRPTEKLFIAGASLVLLAIAGVRGFLSPSYLGHYLASSLAKLLEF